MNKTYKKIALFTSIFVLLLFACFVINQTAQIVQLAEKVNPTFGRIVFWSLLAAYAILILIPVVVFLRLPRSLMPPRSEEAPEFHAHLETLRKRLASNPHLKARDLSKSTADRRGVVHPGPKGG